MNFKSKILKLSIIIMLVLVLIPAIAAEDSSESFFVEYADESDEDIVEESDSIDEVEQTQVEDVSVDSEIVSSEFSDESDIINNNINDEKSEEIQIEDNHCEDPIEENQDTVIIPEHIDCSVEETHNIIEERENNNNIYFDNYENVSDDVNNDVDEYRNCELTIENICIINHGSVFNSKSNLNVDAINHALINTATLNFETQSFKRGLIKVSELKNNLLINQDISFIFADNLMADVDGDVIICNDKTSNDFIFSIDNSVVGDGNLIIFVTTSFCLNFDSCFDAFICRDFFDVEYFFGGNSRDCCWSFCRNFQEICSCDLILL